MMHLLLLEVLPEGCVLVMPVSDTAPPPLGVGFHGVFLDGYHMPNLIAVAHVGMGRFIARQATGKFQVSPLELLNNVTADMFELVGYNPKPAVKGRVTV